MGSNWPGKKWILQHYFSLLLSSTGRSSITVGMSWWLWGLDNTKHTTGPGATPGRSLKRQDFLKTQQLCPISVSSLCTVTSSLSVSPNLTQTHKPFHCWCYLENGSSLDCCVHQSVMNINEEPPHQQTCIVHQPVDLFVLTPVEISFHFICIPSLPAGELFFWHHGARKEERKSDARSIAQP